MCEERPNYVFVTGASGFLGSALVPHLLNGGYRVKCLMHKSLIQSNADIDHIAVTNIENDSRLKSALGGCKVFFHLAGRAHILKDQHYDPASEYRRSNVELTINLARQAARSGVKRFILVSTVKVNGEFTTDGVPFGPDDPPKPEEHYAISKLEAEEALKKICAETGMEFVIIRPPLVYGSGVRANFLTMLKLANSGFPLPFRALKHKRSLVYVDNLVSLLLKVLDHPSALNETFLVSDDHDISIADLLFSIGRESGHHVRLFTVPIGWLALIFKAFGKKHLIKKLLHPLRVDISKTKKILDWEPPITFEDAIAKTTKKFTSI